MAGRPERLAGPRSNTVPSNHLVLIIGIS